jgi:hypothetical protein
MTFHRTMQFQSEALELESVLRMKKWTAISCFVIVVVARVLWEFAH